ncbi:MAG: hypothetical protein NVSMB32_10210 [Actinomycetota bacterium]
MSPTHHSAVTGTAGSLFEELEYRPFSGYGGHDRFYPVCAPYRGNSTIPHHVAVESREDGEANGRIFYATNTTWVSPRETARLRAPRVFNMNARHSAISAVLAETHVVTNGSGRPPLPPVTRTRARPGEALPEPIPELVGASE